MSALSANRDSKHKEGVLVRYPVKTGVTIYKGGLVCTDSTGYAKPGADASGNIPLGVAFESADNSAGADGALYVKVWKSGSFEFAKGSAAITDVGDLMYIVDDQTVAATTTNSIKAGYCIGYVDSSTLRVRIDSITQ